MQHLNSAAIIISAVLAFVLSAIWYIVFAKARAALNKAAASVSSKPSLPQVIAEVIKNLIVATIIGMLISHVGVGTGMGSVSFALLLWIGFPVMILASSVMYENVSAKLAAIHAGDWLIKLLAISAIVGNWR